MLHGTPHGASDEVSRDSLKINGNSPFGELYERMRTGYFEAASIWHRNCIAHQLIKPMDEKTTATLRILQQREALLDTKQCMGCMHEGMLVTSLDGTILEVAPAAEHILGTPSTALKGALIQTFCAAPEAYWEIGRQAIRDGRVGNRSLLMFAGAGKR